MNVGVTAPLMALAISACAPSTTTAVESVPLGDASPRCAEEYTPTAVGRRAFAFDGEVLEIHRETAEHATSEHDVRFRVNEWFTGGSGDRVTVQMLSPGALTSVDNVTFEVGARLLVSGEPRWGGDPLESAVGWACGFTRPHTADDASQWRAAFGDAPSG